MVWATWRNRMSSRRSRPWVRVSSAMDLREPGVDGGVGGGEAVDVSEPEVAADAVHHRVDRGRHQPALAEVADVELDVRAFDPDERVEAVGLAPGEPAAQLVGVEVVGRSRVAGQERHRGELGRGHGGGLEGQQPCPGLWIVHRCLTRRSVGTSALAADAAVLLVRHARPQASAAIGVGAGDLAGFTERGGVLGSTFGACQNRGTTRSACG